MKIDGISKISVEAVGNRIGEGATTPYAVRSKSGGNHAGGSECGEFIVSKCPVIFYRGTLYMRIEVLEV